MIVQPLDFRLEYFDNSFDCTICGKENLVRGLVHNEGEDHPQCEECVRKWSLEKEDPTCAFCRKWINPASFMSKLEIEEGSKKRKKERSEREEELLREDREVAELLSREDAGFMDRAFASFTGGDAALASRLQAQAYKEQNPLWNPCVWVSAAIMSVAGIFLMNAFKG